MIWKVIYTSEAEKFFKRLKKNDGNIALRIVDAVSDVKGDPYQVVERLRNSPYYKLRIGEYRVVLDLRRRDGIIIVMTINKHSRAYRR